MLASIVCNDSYNRAYRLTICLTSGTNEKKNSNFFLFDLIHTSKNNHTYIEKHFGNRTFFFNKNALIILIYPCNMCLSLMLPFLKF